MRVLIVLVVLTLLAGSAATLEAACIRGELANFDVHNFTNQPVNDFTLILFGITCRDISEYYRPDLYDSIKCWEDQAGTHIKWYFRPIPPCSSIHFGVRLMPGVGAPRVLFAALTMDCQPVALIPFPWQAWEGSIECPIWDIISGNETIPSEGVLISRRAAFSPRDIPLDLLTVDSPEIQSLNWFYEDLEPRWLFPVDSELRLEMWPTNTDRAAVVMYTVASISHTPYLVFLSEALIELGPSSTESSTWGKIKALYR